MIRSKMGIVWNWLLLIAVCVVTCLDAVVMAKDNSDAKEAELLKRIETISKEISSSPRRSELYVARARAYLEKRDSAAARKDLNEAIRLDPNCASAFFHRAQGSRLFGNFPEALADINKAILLAPKNSAAYVERADLQAENFHRLEEAIADCDKALAMNPKDPRAYLIRGYAYDRLKKYPQAIADFGSAISLDSHFGLAYLNRASTYSKTNEFAKAIDDYSALLTLSQSGGFPPPAYVLQYRGGAYFASGRYEEAVADYTEAISRQPEMQMYRARAQAYDKLGKHDLADNDRKKAGNRIE